MKRTQIARRTPLRSHAVTGLRPKAARNSRQLPDIGPAARADLYAANDEHCTHCGKWLALTGAHVHHRLKRSQGGTNDINNLMLLAPSCHEDIHANVARSYELGHLVRRGDDPASVRIRELAPHWAVAS